MLLPLIIFIFYNIKFFYGVNLILYQVFIRLYILFKLLYILNIKKISKKYQKNIKNISKKYINISILDKIMVIYKCFRCGYTNKIKSSFINHLNRKFICKPKIKEIETLEIYNFYFNNNKKRDIAKSSQNIAKSSQNIAKSSPNIVKSSPNIIKCKFCFKNFKHKSSKYKHEKYSCKVKKDKDNYQNLKELVKLLNEQLKEKDKIISKKDKRIDELLKKTGITIGTQNIQNNTHIKILAYNKTDISHLNDKDYLNILSHANLCVPHMIKKIHFDKEKPENHNIYISNLKNSYIMMYDGFKWNIRDRTEIIDDMIEDNTNILEDKIEDWLEKGEQYPKIMKKFNRYIEKKENDLVLDKIKQEIKFILYNNRKVISNDL